MTAVLLGGPPLRLRIRTFTVPPGAAEPTSIPAADTGSAPIRRPMEEDS